MSEPSKSPNGKVADIAKNPRTWLAVVIAVCAIAFIAQNREPVTSNLLMLQFTAPQWVTLAVVFVAGLVTGLLVYRSRKK